MKDKFVRKNIRYSVELEQAMQKFIESLPIKSSTNMLFIGLAEKEMTRLGYLKKPKTKR